MHQYAGQQMTNGAQAEVYADHFIANHLKEIGGGQTYAQLSAKSLTEPKNAALAGQVQTMFRGETLRGLLLNAYAFWKMGQIALWGAAPEAEKRLRGNLAADIAQVYPDATAGQAHAQLVYGHPAEVLIDASEDADLLVVGHRGHDAFTGMLLGSVSLHCVTGARCPVVVIRGA